MHADWDDGPYNMTISEAFACAERMPPKPKKPEWDNNTPLACELGPLTWGIYEMRTMNDRKMHTHTMSGHCFVWNAPNQKYEDGFRLFTLRCGAGWARVSIMARTLDTLIAGTGSRMYCGHWRNHAAECGGARMLNGEAIVLLDYDGMYVWGEDTVTQADVEAMKVKVREWYESLPLVDVPAATDEELARKITRR